MATGPSPSETAELNVEALRKKYLDLCRKYAALVERFERRTQRQSDAFELGRWGLEQRGSALALVSGGHIELANTAFNELSQSQREWRIEGDPLRVFPTLRSAVLDEAHRVLSSRRERSTELRSADRVISMRVEFRRRGRTPIALALLEDLTPSSRHDEELSKMREALLQRERVRVLGLLAAAVAHDLGSTLRGASYQLASLRPFGFRDRAAALQGAIERLDIASEIVSRLHDFARTGSVPAAAPVRLARTIQKAVSLIELDRTASGKPLTVKTSLPELPPVRGNEVELSLLFVNLLRNSRDAMPDGGTVRIEARRVVEGVRVTVADNGPGIPVHEQSRIFSAFYTTKGTAGSGLGLWLAKSTMARLGGSITLAKGKTRGAAFTLIFPVLNPSEAGLSPAPAAKPSPAARRPRRVPRTGRRS